MTTSIGLPYAVADVDERGYFVTCPVCSERFYGSGSEDAATKGAGRLYGLHFVEAHPS